MLRRIQGLLAIGSLIWILTACGGPKAGEKQSLVSQAGCAICVNKEGVEAVLDTALRAPGGSAAWTKPGEEPNQAEDIQQYLRQATVQIQGPKYWGSGVVWAANEDELVIATAAHVIWDNSPMVVQFDRGEPVEARLVHVSDQADVAFLAVSLQETEDRGAVWQEARQDGEICERLKAGQPLWIMGSVEAAADRASYGSVIEPWIYIEDFDNYMLLGHAYAIPGVSGGGVFTPEGILVGILCGGNEADQVAVLPWSVMEANRE